MTLLAKQVPEYDWKFVWLVVEPHTFGARDESILGLAWSGYSGQIALDVGGEYRHALARKLFGQNLQCNGLAGAGRASDQAMAVRQSERQVLRRSAFTQENFAILFHARHRVSSRFLQAPTCIFQLPSQRDMLIGQKASARTLRLSHRCTPRAITTTLLAQAGVMPSPSAAKRRTGR